MIRVEPLPVLDLTRCTGCGDCVTICPTDCLAMRGLTVWLPRPTACIGCSACEWVCPFDAVRVPAVTVPLCPGS